MGLATVDPHSQKEHTVACVASVSVQFGSKELQGDKFGIKELQGDKFGSNPVLRSLLHGNACYAG